MKKSKSLTIVKTTMLFKIKGEKRIKNWKEGKQVRRRRRRSEREEWKSIIDLSRVLSRRSRSRGQRPCVIADVDVAVAVAVAVGPGTRGFLLAGFCWLGLSRDIPENIRV